MSLVEMRSASRLWDGVVGLHPFDLRVERGELVVVRGRSGSGKSTLLALVAGLCEPDGGDVRVGGAQPRMNMPWSQLAIVLRNLKSLTLPMVLLEIAMCFKYFYADLSEFCKRGFELSEGSEIHFSDIFFTALLWI